MNNLLIVGAGQYGEVVRDIAISTGSFGSIDFVDDDSDKAIGRINELSRFFENYKCAIVAIGNPKVRSKMFDQLESIGYRIVTLIHDSSYVAKSATLGKGCVVEAMSVVNSNVVIGDGTFVCAGAVVNHDCTIGNFCQIDVNATIKSNVVILDNIKVEC